MSRTFGVLVELHATYDDIKYDEITSKEWWASAVEHAQLSDPAKFDGVTIVGVTGRVFQSAVDDTDKT